MLPMFLWSLDSAQEVTVGQTVNAKTDVDRGQESGNHCASSKGDGSFLLKPGQPKLLPMSDLKVCRL